MEWELVNSMVKGSNVIETLRFPVSGGYLYRVDVEAVTQTMVFVEDRSSPAQELPAQYAKDKPQPPQPSTDTVLTARRST